MKTKEEKEVSSNNYNVLLPAPMVDGIHKLTIFSINRLLLNLRHFKLPKTKKVSSGLDVVNYLRNIKRQLCLLSNHNSGNTANLLLLKLLFKDLRVFYDFCDSYGFHYCQTDLIIPYSESEEKIKEYMKIAYINISTRYKILLKEFNLIKFYEQINKMVKIDTNEKFIEKNRSITRKVKKISKLIDFIGRFLYRYTQAILYAYDNYNVEKGMAGHLVPLTIYYMAFYYWIKIINSLLKQYKETMSDDKLKNNINIKLYKYLSLIIIFILLKSASLVAYRLLYRACLSYTSQKAIKINHLEKVLNKIVEVLHKICFDVLDEEGEKSAQYVIGLIDRHVRNEKKKNYKSINREIVGELFGKEKFHALSRICNEVSYGIARRRMRTVTTDNERENNRLSKEQEDRILKIVGEIYMLSDVVSTRIAW